MTKISVVLATYNGARFLDAQLESLLLQSRMPDEVVVGDDESSDATPDILSAFAAKAPFPVTVLRNSPRKGYRNNFMDASASANGDLIAFCDQDDVWRADKLEKVEAAFNAPDIMLVHHNAQLVDADGRPTGMLRDSDAFPALAKPLSLDPWFFPLGFCQAFRRELVQFSHLRRLCADFYFDGEVFAHDQWYFFLAGVFGDTAYLDENLADYRQHGRNTYGLSDKSGLWKRFSIMCKVGWPTFRRRSASVDGRLAVLRRMELELAADPGRRLRVQAAIERYSWFAEASGLRAGCYGGRSILRRAGAWLRLVQRGGYGDSRPWAFGVRSMARDGFFGVLLGGDKAAPLAASAAAAA